MRWIIPDNLKDVGNISPAQLIRFGCRFYCFSCRTLHLNNRLDLGRENEKAMILTEFIVELRTCACLFYL